MGPYGKSRCGIRVKADTYEERGAAGVRAHRGRPARRRTACCWTIICQIMDVAELRMDRNSLFAPWWP